MSDFPRINDEVVDFVHKTFLGQGALRNPGSVRDFLERIEPLLVGPHIAYIVGESTPEESDRDYMTGMTQRLIEVENAVKEALDDLNPHGGGITRRSVQVTSDGDLNISNSADNVVGSMFQVGVVQGGVRSDRR